MSSPGRKILRTIADLIFPPLCLICGAPPEQDGDISFCSSCINRVELLAGPLCPCCGRIYQKAAGGRHLCGKCLTDKWHFTLARGLVLYEEPISNVIHRFKYQGQTVSLKTFKAIFNMIITEPEYTEPDIVIPIPLHPKKLRQRGFNQAIVLARSLYPGKLVNHKILQRVKHTDPQTGLSGPERRRNLKNAFQVTDKEDLHDKRIVLVDDVFTTGTTVNECAKMLKKAGAEKVLVLTLARVAD